MGKTVVTDHRKPRALFVSRKQPWPLRSGSSLRLATLLGALAETHAIDLLAPPPEGQNSIPAGVSLVPMEPWRERGGYERALLWLAKLRYPIDALDRTSPSHQVQGLRSRNSYDLVWVYRAELAYSIMTACGTGPLIVDADDNDVYKIQLLLPMAPRKGGLLRKRLRDLFLREDQRRHVDVFKDLARRGAVLCFARPDEQPPAGLEFSLVRNSLADPGFILPSVRAPKPGAGAFLGEMRYAPNAEAALEVATKVLPALRGSHPETALVLIGQTRPEAREDLESAGAHLLGFVSDLDEALEGVTAMLTPLRRGSGVSLKAIEALARGIPLISTEFGVRGLGLTSGVHYLRAETPGEFADAWGELLSDYPARANALAEAGRVRYELEHSESAVALDVQRAVGRAKQRSDALRSQKS